MSHNCEGRAEVISQSVGPIIKCMNICIQVRKRTEIRNRYKQAPHLTQDTNGKVTTSQLDITNESQDVSPIPASYKVKTESVIKLD